MKHRSLPWWRRLALWSERRWHRVCVLADRDPRRCAFVLLDARRPAYPPIEIPYDVLPAFARFVASLDVTREVTLETRRGDRIVFPPCAIPALQQAVEHALAAGRPTEPAN